MMEVADCQTNCKGGSQNFWRLFNEASALASPSKKPRLAEVAKKFDSKTRGIHKGMLDTLIREWQQPPE